MQEAVHKVFTIRTFSDDDQALTVGGEPLSAELIATGLPVTICVCALFVQFIFFLEKGTTTPKITKLNVVDMHDGTYTVKVVVPHRIADTVSWSLRLKHGDIVVMQPNLLVRAIAPFIGTPTGRVLTGEPSAAPAAAAQTYLFGSSVYEPIAVGAPLVLAVQPVTADGHPAKATDALTDTLVLTLRGPPSSGPANIDLPLQPSSDGKVAELYGEPRAQLATGYYLLEAKLNGESIHGAPAVVRVVTPIAAGEFEPLATVHQSRRALVAHRHCSLQRSPTVVRTFG